MAWLAAAAILIAPRAFAQQTLPDLGGGDFAISPQLERRIGVRVECRGPTGVEMEALTGAAVGLLTVYDMVKAVDRGMTLEGVRLEEKSGGRSGAFRRRGS